MMLILIPKNQKEDEIYLIMKFIQILNQLEQFEQISLSTNSKFNSSHIEQNLTIKFFCLDSNSLAILLLLSKVHLKTPKKSSEYEFSLIYSLFKYA